jgi:CRP-like cAMP-binding protein
MEEQPLRPFDYFKQHQEFVEFKAGEVIFNQDEIGKVMYAVKEGEVEIIYSDLLLEIVREGEFFGEMSLVDSSPRSAKAVAKTDCKLVVVDKYHFLFLVHQSPTFSLDVMLVMAQRIRKLQQIAAK